MNDEGASADDVHTNQDVGKHYMSNACIHEKHEVCDEECAYCHDGCACSCHPWNETTLTLDEPGCQFCMPQKGVQFDPRDQHPSCAARAVVGGIGHLVDHAYWCGERGDPDAGLSYRDSALRVAEWLKVHGAERDGAVEGAGDA